LGFIDPEDEAAAILGNVGDSLLINTWKYLRSYEIAATPL